MAKTNRNANITQGQSVSTAQGVTNGVGESITYSYWPPPTPREWLRLTLLNDLGRSLWHAREHLIVEDFQWLQREVDTLFSTIVENALSESREKGGRQWQA